LKIVFSAQFRMHQSVAVSHVFTLSQVIDTVK